MNIQTASNVLGGTLSVELVIEIFLNITSIRDLGHLFTASRFLYRCFLSRKRQIIFAVLQSELGPVLTDARFLERFPYKGPEQAYQPSEHRDWIHDMTARYMGMLSRGADDPRREDAHTLPTADELDALCFTLSAMNFLSDVYFAAQRRCFGGAVAAAAPPSSTERLRVLRAFYRRQIVCNAWAPKMGDSIWTHQDSVAISNTNGDNGVRLGLFAAFEPWELQQIEHVHVFVIHLCTALVLASERHDGEVFGALFVCPMQLALYMWTHPTVQEAAMADLPWSWQPPGRGGGGDVESVAMQYRDGLCCLGLGWQFYLRERLPDPVRDWREAEERIEFTGDDVDLPPFGWVHLLNGRYVSWFGEGLQCVAGAGVTEGNGLEEVKSNLVLWRESGFALWDRSRVEAMVQLGRWRHLQAGWILSDANAIVPWGQQDSGLVVLVDRDAEEAAESRVSVWNRRDLNRVVQTFRRQRFTPPEWRTRPGVSSQLDSGSHQDSTSDSDSEEDSEESGYESEAS
ncbi:hypothetical protein RJ55_05257 [Drechmeria coniospora]|nr:hypothetical protein RJ55_05257 [Drechmeria coniospora]